MNDKILFGVTQDNEFLTINIPVDLLIHALENHEDCEGIKVKNIPLFINEVIHRLEGACYNDHGEPIFTGMLDECLMNIVEGYDDCLEYPEDEEYKQ